MAKRCRHRVCADTHSLRGAGFRRYDYEMRATVGRNHRRRWLEAEVSGRIDIEDAIRFLRTVRANPDDSDWPLLFDATSATSGLAAADVDRAVAVVRDALSRSGLRAHVAIVADDPDLHHWFLEYETKCAESGVRVIRVFPERARAEAWLDAVAVARRFA